jgi:hypothetical protein
VVTAIPSATPALAQVAPQRTVTFTNTSNPDQFGGSNDFQNCLRVATFGGTAPIGATAYLPPNTEIVKIVATGAAGHGGSRPSGGSSSAGNGGNGAQVTAAFSFNAAEELTISPGAKDSTANQDDEGLGGTSPGDGVGGNAALVATTDVTVNGSVVTVNGLGECGYSASHMLVVAGGGGGGGQSSLLHHGGNAGNAGDDSSGGVGQNGTNGDNNAELPGCGGGSGGGGGSLSAGGNGGGGGSCPLTSSGSSGSSGTFLTKSPQTEPPASSGDGAGGNSTNTAGGGGGGGGGGYYEGGGAGGSTFGGAGGGGGGGSSFIASSTAPGTAHSMVASNTSNNSSVTITAVTALDVLSQDVSYVYGSGPLPAVNNVTYTGFLGGDTASSLGGSLSCTTTATPASQVGDYPITCSGLTSSDYVVHFIPATLHITSAGSTTSMQSITSGTVGAAATLSAKVAPVSPSTAPVNEGTVSFSVVDGTGKQVATAGPASVAGGSASAQLTTSGLAAGGYTVNASYAPSKDYTASSTQATLFLLHAGVSLASTDVGVVLPNANGTTANVDNSAIAVNAVGGNAGDTVVVAQYTTDPQSVAPPSAANTYFDVYVPPATAFQLISVRICPPALGNGQIIYWWNGTAWAQVSDQFYNSGCVTAQIQPTGSAPTVEQLSGTPFGEQSTSGSQCNLSAYPSQGGALNLNKATISGCNLRKAGLAGANLSKVAAIGAYLRDAVLQGANLNSANLAQAYLAGANLTGANLAGANLTGANVTGVQWSNTTCPDGTNSNNDGGTCVGHLL